LEGATTPLERVQSALNRGALSFSGARSALAVTDHRSQFRLFSFSGACLFSSARRPLGRFVIARERVIAPRRRCNEFLGSAIIVKRIELSLSARDPRLSLCHLRRSRPLGARDRLSTADSTLITL
jgi:hypothetical protein